MSERRLSARTSAIEKRRLLEEKLQERERRRSAREASRTDNIGQQSVVESDEVDEEPAIEQAIADQVEEDNPPQVEGSSQSLDWDHSGDPPSFISASLSPIDRDQGAILNYSVICKQTHNQLLLRVFGRQGRCQTFRDTLHLAGVAFYIQS